MLVNILQIIVSPFQDKFSLFLIILQFINYLLNVNGILDVLLTLSFLYINCVVEEIQRYKNLEEVSKFKKFFCIMGKKLIFSNSDSNKEYKPLGYDNSKKSNKSIINENKNPELISKNEILSNQEYDVQFMKSKKIHTGDVIHLTIGDRIPGDCIIIKQELFKTTNFLKVDESMLTGEEESVLKKCSNILWNDVLNFRKKIENNSISNENDNLLYNLVAQFISEKNSNVYANSEINTNLQRIISGNSTEKNYKNKEFKHKQEKKNTFTYRIPHDQLLVSGTYVLHGSAICLVLNSGKSLNEIKTTLDQIDSNLTTTVGQLQSILFTIILTISILLFGISLTRTSALKSAEITVALAVTAMPEGLVLVVKIVLSVVVFKLKKNMIYVKKLDAMERAGMIDMIVFDKTGTLTKNEQIVKGIIGVTLHENTSNNNNIAEQQSENINSTIFYTENNLKHIKFSSIDEDAIIEGVCFYFNEILTIDNKLMGDIIDIALKKMVTSSEVNSKLLHFTPFCTEKMISRGILQINNKKYDIIKGAPEQVLTCCQFFDNGNPLTEEHKKIILMNLTERAVSIGYKKMYSTNSNFSINKTQNNENTTTRSNLICYNENIENTINSDNTSKQNINTYDFENKIEKNYRIKGFITFENKLRNGVKECLKWCEKNNVDVIVLTGDSMKSTASVMDRIGIVSEYYDSSLFNDCNSNTELNNLQINNNIKFNTINNQNKSNQNNNIDSTYDHHRSINSVDRLINNIISNRNIIKVFYRASPLMKHKIIKKLQNHRKVLMAGDGINDLLAIKQADIGVSLGEGSDLSKEISDIILTDSNINNILLIIQSGRLCLHNVKSVLKYLISSNIGEVLIVTLSILNNKKILNSKQLLFINVLTDGLPATFLCLNKEYSIQKYLLFRTIIISLFIGLFTYYINDTTKSFLFIVICEMYNSLNNISQGTSLIYSYKGNKLLCIIVLCTLIVSYLMTRIKYIRILLEIEKIGIKEYIVLGIIGTGVIIIEEIMKTIRV